MTSRERMATRLLGAFAIRAGLVAFGLVLALLLMEAVLQAGAAYTRVTGRPEPTGWLTTRRRVMCVGDSNTYGLFVERNQTYPVQLEKIWNAASPGSPVEVLNFGVPGLNSSKLQQRFRGLLDTFRPEVVLVLIGANDPYTEAVPATEDETPTPTGILETLQRYSRVARFFFMLERGWHAPEVDIRINDGVGVVRGGGREIDLFATKRLAEGWQRDWRAQLSANIVALARDAAAHDARLVLLTYASHQALYGNANRVTRDIPVKDPVVDLEIAFNRVCPDPSCPQLFLPDQHPNPAGYQLMAAVIWRKLCQIGIASLPKDAAAPFRQLDEFVVSSLDRLGMVPKETGALPANDQAQPADPF